MGRTMASAMIPPEHAHEFLASCGWEGARIEPLAGDASFRRYFRVIGEGRQAVLMDAPPPHEDPRPFAAVGQWLIDHGLSAPRVLASDLDKGLLLLRDFGNVRFRTDHDVWIRGDHITFISGFDVSDITQLQVPQLKGIPGSNNGKLKFHKKGHAQLLQAFDDIERLGLLKHIKTCAGSLNFRLRKPTSGVLSKLPSNHAFGIANRTNPLLQGLPSGCKTCDAKKRVLIHLRRRQPLRQPGMPAIAQIGNQQSRAGGFQYAIRAKEAADIHASVLHHR